ncbi:aqualysin-1-like [Diadema setosum]|uniref:aqualysin-1-like n=1 Tax=Diadema setosum TaxID=31175 RepID=UPI003B3A4083
MNMNMNIIFVLFALVGTANTHFWQELVPLLRNPDKFINRHIVVLENDVDVSAFARRFSTDPALIKKTTLVRTLQTALKAVIVDLDPKTVKVVRFLPGVSYVEEDKLGYVEVESWGTDRINQRNLPLDGNDSGAGGKIYIIDTGIRVTHNDFGGRAVWAANYVDTDNSDCNGHGTHCAGTAAGTKYGVAKKANVYAVKVCDCRGSCPTSAVVSGVDYVARQKRARVKSVVAAISLSINSVSLTQAVKGSIQMGVVVVTSSGNNGYDACNLVPGNIDEVITVGNTQKDDTMRHSSNYGKCVDILAPGTSITSASHLSDSGSAVKTGTSMACPHVAGAAAILMANRNIQPNAVSATLVKEASPDKIKGDLKNTPNKLLYLPPKTNIFLHNNTL